MKPRTPGHWLIAAIIGLFALSSALAVLAFLPSSASGGMTPEDVKYFEGAKAKAEKGDANAQFSLGNCYENGNGVTKDEVEGVKWYRKAADQGNAYAQTNLGLCYANGTGVAKDEIEAYAYWNIAGGTDEYSRKGLAILEKKLSPEARVRGQQRTKELQKEIEAKTAAKKAEESLEKVKAFEGYKTKAENGDASAQFHLGVCYATGKSVARDLSEAVKWYRKAAEQGFAPAQFNLGVCYASGRGVTKNEAEAVKWYRKSADQGFANAQYNLGFHHEYGTGVPKDLVESYAYWSLAGRTDEDARKKLAILKNNMSPDTRMLGQRRTKELQKEIEAKIAAKQAEDEKKSGK